MRRETETWMHSIKDGLSSVNLYILYIIFLYYQDSISIFGKVIIFHLFLVLYICNTKKVHKHHINNIVY